MRVTVVINTCNRATSLETTLQALRYQTFDDFEVVVVNGPSTDGTPALLERWAEAVRVEQCPEAHLAKSRNIGVAAARGEIVAFIDDDAIPEPNWLAHIVAGYDAEGVGGVGGFVYDATGFAYQWRYACCDRLGHVRPEVEPPPPTCTTPGADPFLYLQGTNCSFRRACLAKAGGFDEALEHYYDDSEISMRILDLGYEVKVVPHARVHHKTLGNRTRNEARVILSPLAIIADHAYFATRNGSTTRTREEVERSVQKFADGLCAGADDALSSGQMTRQQHERFMQEVSEGLVLGVMRARAGGRGERAFPPVDPEEFRRYPRCVPDDGPRLHVCLISKECPPEDCGGVGRYSYDLAVGLAQLGHVVRVVTSAADQSRVEFRDGFWLHRLLPWKRWVPELDQVPLQYNLYHVTAAYHEVCRIHETMPVDLVSAPLWLCEGLLCSLDDRFTTVLSLHTAMKTIASMHPSWAASAQIGQLIALERATLRRTRHVYANSRAIVAKVRDEYGVEIEGAVIVPHGIRDRSPEVARRAPRDRVRVLFVSRLERRKGVDTILEAAVQLLPELPQLEFVIVGRDTPYTEMTETYRRAFERAHGRDPRIAGRVCFTGEVGEQDLYQRYADADLFCVPSRYESFGLVYLEAMMFGVPVVATNVGGIPEVVEHEGNGLLVRPDDPGALADALRRLVLDEGLRAAYGRRSRELYERRFTVEAMARGTLAAYREILVTHRTAAQGGLHARAAA